MKRFFLDLKTLIDFGHLFLKGMGGLLMDNLISSLVSLEFQNHCLFMKTSSSI